jgi:hypothetical protein
MNIFQYIAIYFNIYLFFQQEYCNKYLFFKAENTIAIYFSVPLSVSIKSIIVKTKYSFVVPHITTTMLHIYKYTSDTYK